MSRRTRKEDSEAPSGTREEPNRRGFLRQAALAGAALAAGAGGLSVSGCCKKPQVEVKDGALVVLDEDLSIELTRIWNAQRAANLPEATGSMMGIPVRFDSLVVSGTQSDGSDGPEPEKIVSLCRC